MAKLRDVLTDSELNKLIQISDLGINCGERDLRYLSVDELSQMFTWINLRCIKNGRMPEGNIVSFVWEELADRAIEKKLSIF